MKLKIKTTEGREFEVFICGSKRVDFLKEMIEEEIGTPPPMQRLSYGSEILKDYEPLNKYKLTFGSVVHIVHSPLAIKPYVCCHNGCLPSKCYRY